MLRIIIKYVAISLTILFLSSQSFQLRRMPPSSQARCSSSKLSIWRLNFNGYEFEKFKFNATMELEHLKLKESMDIEIMKSKESMDIEIMKSKESMNIATMKSKESMDIATMKSKDSMDIEIMKLKESMDIATMKSKDSMNIEIMKSNERKAIDQKNRRFALLQLVVGTALILAFLLLFVQSAVFIRDGLLGKKSSNITIFTFLAVAIAQIMQGMVPAVNFAKWIVNVTYSFFR